MHSRVYEMRTKRIPEIDFMEDSFFFDGESSFVGAIADYVENLTTEEYAEAVAYLKESLQGVADFDPVDGSIVFKEDFKEVYFKSSYESFMKMSQKLSLEEFCTTEAAYTIGVITNDRFGSYISFEGSEPDTINSFIRSYAESNTPYYLGGIVGYHS